MKGSIPLIGRGHMRGIGPGALNDPSPLFRIRQVCRIGPLRDRLRRIFLSQLNELLGNQAKILRNQQAIIKNQKKILASYGKILTKLSVPAERR